MKPYKAFSLLLLILTIIIFDSKAFGWSWKDLKVRVTKEEEILKFGGMPYEVSLSVDEYLKLKQGKPASRVSFTYKDSKFLRIYPKFVEKRIYDPLHTPMITEAPLGLSEEIEKIEMTALLEQRILNKFIYFFEFYNRINKSKYIEIFNSMLGGPIQFTEDKDFIVLKYKNYSVTISDLSIVLESI
jgi:hypothetical protein